MYRIIVLLAVLVIGAAAPARAWCEASCLAPTPDGPSHCPSHEPADATASISATSVDECPALESARPTAPARLDASAPPVSCHSPVLRTSPIHSPIFVGPDTTTTVFERSTPLRI